LFLSENIALRFNIYIEELLKKHTLKSFINGEEFGEISRGRVESYNARLL